MVWDPNPGSTECEYNMLSLHHGQFLAVANKNGPSECALAFDLETGILDTCI